MLIQKGPHSVPAAVGDPLKRIHELQAFQIELEIQNEELWLSQQVLIDSEKRYTDLYEFASVG